MLTSAMVPAAVERRSPCDAAYLDRGSERLLRQRCASLAGIVTKRRADRMHSFVLAQTLKCLLAAD